MKKVGKIYSVPTLGLVELVVEKGFSLSSNYGGYGEAGQGSGFIDNDYEL